MASGTLPNRQRHDQAQLHYFERGVKRTMIPTGSRYLRRHVDEALRVAGFRPGEQVLEVGCGMGRYTLLLAQKGARVEGLDISMGLLERLRAYNTAGPEIPLHCVGLEDVSAGIEGRFDLVAGFFMLHHLHDIGEGLKGAARCLKPGGRAVFLEPNPYNALFYVQMLITPGMTWQGDRGLTRMRRRLIKAAMQGAGLTGFSTTRFGFFPPALANTAAGARLERTLERFPPWRALLPFQVFLAHKPVSS